MFKIFRAMGLFVMLWSADDWNAAAIDAEPAGSIEADRLGVGDLFLLEHAMGERGGLTGAGAGHDEQRAGRHAFAGNAGTKQGGAPLRRVPPARSRPPAY